MNHNNFETAIPNDFEPGPTGDDYVSDAFVSIIQKTMFDMYFENGRVLAPPGFENGFDEHLSKHLFFITFDYANLDRYNCEPRVAEFLSAGLYYDLLADEIEAIIEQEDGVDTSFLPDLYTAFYGIVFGQNQPLNFKRKFWDADAFDMALLVHPALLPYFERYIDKFNKIQNGVLLQFTKSSPFRNLKMTRYNPETHSLHKLIEKRVSVMDDDDMKPLFDESYTYLQELPSRAHVDTDFYVWQNNLSGEVPQASLAEAEAEAEVEANADDDENAR